MDKNNETWPVIQEILGTNSNIKSLQNPCYNLSLKNNNNTNALTFLKSNYKYKRRQEQRRSQPLAAATRSESNGDGCSDTHVRESDSFTFSVILRIFIVIIGKLIMQQGKVAQQQRLRLRLRRKHECMESGRGSANVTGARAAASELAANDVSVLDVVAAAAAVDSDVINYQANYDNVSTRRYDNIMYACQHQALQQQQQQQQQQQSYGRRCCTAITWQLVCSHYNSNTLRHRTSTASATAAAMPPSSAPPAAGSGGVNRRRRHRLKALSMFMTLFIALALGARSAEAGACWQTAADNGKCKEIFSRNISRAECCAYGQELSYTDRELTSVEYFFATAIGEGIECAPCMETCKHVNCGPNKKCVKRKGRPKCICAPQCGAGVRRKQQQRGERLYRGHQHHSEQLRAVVVRSAAAQQTAQEQQQSEEAEGEREEETEQEAAVGIFGKSLRDIRSLSSEITNINLGLDAKTATAQQQLQQQQQQQQQQQHNQNQRKIIIMQSQSQQKPQIGKREQKPRRLLIDANVEQEEEKPTTRRLQILSNVRVGGGAVAGGGAASHRRRTNNKHGSNNDAAKLRTETGREAAVSRHHQQQNSHNNNNNNNNRHKAQASNELAVTKQQHDKTAHNRNQQQQRHRNQHHNSNNNSSSSSNAGVRRIHQNVSAAVGNDTPNRGAEVASKHQARHQQTHRKRKHHNRSKQKKLKDPNANSSSSSSNITTASSSASATTASAAAVYNTTTTLPTMSSATASTAVAPTLPLPLAETTIKSATQTMATTPANSTSSADHQDLLNHGSSTAATSSSPTAAAAAQLPNVGVGGNSANGNDLTLLDDIYDKYNLHGFPSQQHQHSITHFEAGTQHGSHPVCGTDGRTYNTECQLKKRACRTDNPNLQVAYRGHCKTTCNGVKCLNGLTCVEDHYTIPHCIACKIDCAQDDDDDAAAGDRLRSGAATATSRAVCGVDGKTYKSACDINRMICKIGRSIAVAYPGPCRADRVTCGDINCGPKHTCLVDLLTHEPRCVSCRYKCSRKRRPASLRFEEGKICGVNNRNYNSWCEMRKDSCSTGFLIDVKSAGECH